jgi:hypothetical protein
MCSSVVFYLFGLGIVVMPKLTKEVAKKILDNCKPEVSTWGSYCIITYMEQGEMLIAGSDIEFFTRALGELGIGCRRRESTYFCEGVTHVYARELLLYITKNGLIAALNETIPGLDYEQVSGFRNTCRIS